MPDCGCYRLIVPEGPIWGRQLCILALGQKPLSIDLSG
jgi:hypothetical protein